MNNLFNKRYSIRLIWLIFISLALTFCAVFLAFKFFGHWKTSASLDYTAKITLAILAFLTLMYHIHNLENQIKTQENSNRQNLAKYTYDICSDFRRPMMMDVNEDLRCLINEQSENLKSQKIDQFIAFIDDPSNRKKRQALILTLNYFESVSAMALAGDLDNEIVKRLFGKLFGRYYVKFSPFISTIQLDSAKSWANYEKLALKWLNEEKL
ncbi:DUF4760 domain-containing protein [Chryseobacterium indoltheticum]|uniref:DUF4760 domain-containing protein n=1 Tax=Chryseobacterium indoltheticum TaxID=254 RepID=A0A3G6MYJ9_9FLAO|nr:DUF4760 domain-containing protein [Chryseobacterium indoltheticum]AZA60832.1 DUF4760 domain-containing protein [Chryseobacterium indoltheticum]